MLHGTKAATNCSTLRSLHFTICWVERRFHTDRSWCGSELRRHRWSASSSIYSERRSGCRRQTLPGVCTHRCPPCRWHRDTTGCTLMPATAPANSVLAGRRSADYSSSVAAIAAYLHCGGCCRCCHRRALPNDRRQLARMEPSMLYAGLAIGDRVWVRGHTPPGGAVDAEPAPLDSSRSSRDSDGSSTLRSTQPWMGGVAEVIELGR